MGWIDQPRYKTGREIKETFKKNLMAENDASYVAMKPDRYRDEQKRVDQRDADRTEYLAIVSKEQHSRNTKSQTATSLSQLLQTRR
jgi:hypothetical protein